jgi:hypothetical protein
MLLDALSVRNALKKLSVSSRRAFGAESQRFQLNEPLPESDVSAFEERHSIALPGDYRHFLTRIGNGGAGPFYGVFPLGMMDDAFGLQRWRESDGMVGALAEPFPHMTAWNDLTGKPADLPVGVDLGSHDELDALMELFDGHYWNPSLVNGAIPICHTGCALRIWLVLTGGQAGHLWYDKRAEYGGLMPLTLDDGSPLKFAEWYEGWLDTCLRQASIAKD